MAVTSLRQGRSALDWFSHRVPTKQSAPAILTVGGADDSKFLWTGNYLGKEPSRLHGFSNSADGQHTGA